MFLFYIYHVQNFLNAFQFRRSFSLQIHLFNNYWFYINAGKNFTFIVYCKIVLLGSSSTLTPIIITSSEQDKPDTSNTDSLVKSSDTKKIEEKISTNDEKESVGNQESKQTSLFSETLASNSSDKKNGVKINVEKNVTENSTSFLRPSKLTNSFSSSANNTNSNNSTLPFSLNCPKLNLSESKFGDNTFTNSVVSNTVESPTVNALNNKNNDTKETPSKPSLGIFSSILNSNKNNANPQSSVITVPNFVFGQNLHERVSDAVKATNVKKDLSEETKSNGTSEMLFSSVLSSKDVKENLTQDSFNNSKETCTLIENAAKCQEARASKRKYEEVLVTTGEEEEENVLQVCFRFNFRYIYIY